MKRVIARILQFLGFKPSYSSVESIGGNKSSSGYGKLLSGGYWEYPLKP